MSYPQVSQTVPFLPTTLLYKGVSGQHTEKQRTWRGHTALGTADVQQESRLLA